MLLILNDILINLNLWSTFKPYTENVMNNENNFINDGDKDTYFVSDNL